jgi:hypothetical protein
MTPSASAISHYASTPRANRRRYRAGPPPSLQLSLPFPFELGLGISLDELGISNKLQHRARAFYRLNRNVGGFLQNIHKLGPYFYSVAMPSVGLRAFFIEFAREKQVCVLQYHILQEFV